MVIEFVVHSRGQGGVGGQTGGRPASTERTDQTTLQALEDHTDRRVRADERVIGRLEMVSENFAHEALVDLPFVRVVHSSPAFQMLLVAESDEIVSHLLDPKLLHQHVRRLAEYGEVRVEQLLLAGKQLLEHHLSGSETSFRWVRQSIST